MRSVVLDNFEFVDSKQDGQPSGDRQSFSPSNSSPTPQVVPEVTMKTQAHLLTLILMKMFLFKYLLPHLNIMSTTEILLVEPVDNLGSEGDIVKVRPGYTRIFFSQRTKPYL